MRVFPSVANYIVVDIFATRDSAQSYLPKSGYAAYSQGKEEREITAKRYEEWAKGLWRELFG
jgi:flavodoxin